MKIQYASDLHIEMQANRGWLFKNGLKPAADILVIAGDMAYLGDKSLMHSEYFDWLSEKVFHASVISVAGISHPSLDKNGLMFPKEQAQTKNKIRTILRIALEHRHDALVLGALGCGAFANPPAQVARLIHEVFEEPEFKDQFKKVVFAILEDVNSRRNSSTGNYLPFKKEFELRHATK